MCVIMGWAFGYIRLPYLEAHYAFWIGFAGCLGMMAFMFALYRLWNHQSLIHFFMKEQRAESVMLQQKISRTGMLLSLLGVTLVSLCILFYWNMQRVNGQWNLVRTELEALKHEANLEQQKVKISLLLDLIGKLDSVKSRDPGHPGLDLMMDRIAALSASLKVHKVWDMENKRYRSLSTERGLLLLALVKTRMDSASFKSIKENVSFFGADLANADFQGLDFSGIDLRNANLDYAKLQGIKLHNARLNGASMVGANLDHATLTGANLTGARLNWAKVNEADLQFAKIDSADLSNVTARKSKFNDGTIIHTLLCNAVFIEADLRNCKFLSTNILNTNFSKTILTNVDINDMNLIDPILDYAIIQKDWIELLNDRQNRGINTMLKKYIILSDTTTIRDSQIYRLVRYLR